MHVNVLTELCPVNEPWKTPDKYDVDMTRLFVVDTNFSQGKHTRKIMYGQKDNGVLVWWYQNRKHRFTTNERHFQQYDSLSN